MTYFCTCLAADDLARGLALHQSLLAHAGNFELTVQCLDAEPSLRAPVLPRVRWLSLAELIAQSPGLAAAQSDRTTAEFTATCPAWLMRHLLRSIPASGQLTYLDAHLYFFSSPEPVLAEIGRSSVGVIPWVPRKDVTLRWLSLRHDAAGLACVEAWCARTLAWDFATAPTAGEAAADFFAQWRAKHPQMVFVSHPGANVAPENFSDRAVTIDSTGARARGQPLISYDFSGLVHLGRQLYDAGLHRHGVVPDPVLRDRIYLPYLRQLAGESPDAPDLLPPRRADDPRCGEILAQLLDRTRTAEADRDASQRALEKNRAEARRVIDDVLATRVASERYTREVEVERDQQRQAFFDARQKLLAFHEDLVRNVAYLKTVQAEVEVLQKASVDREAYITSLNEQLARKESGGGGTDLGEFFRAFAPSARGLRRVLVARYHPHLWPAILCLASAGVAVEVLASPSELAGPPRGTLHFWPESLWDWLGGINSLFNEQGYLLANPDVGEALARGVVRSGWDHYQRFGQHEGRPTGSLHFRSGLADADAVMFDSADAGMIVPCLFGRMQPHQQLFVSSCFNPATVWLPPETSRTIVFGDLLCCSQPPRPWVGPRLPSAFPVPNHAPAAWDEIYPAKPCQQALWPKISVITVSFNQAAYLEDTLRSVLEQNYPNLEYIVVDGGSTDGSAAILQKYSDRLAWWVSEKDQGQSHALNKGFAKSTGTILTWLNSDDRLAPGSLFTVAQQFLLHDPDLVVGRCACVTDREPQPHQVHRSVLTFGQLQPLPLAELLDLDRCWLPGWFFHQPEVFFQRRIWERAGGKLREDLFYSMDYDLWVRMAKAGARVLPLPEILALFRVHAAQKTGGPDLPYLPELRAVNAAHRASA